MRLDVHVRGRLVAKLYRAGDEYVLKYLPYADPADFVSLTMPVREEPWRWPRSLHPFFQQNLPEGYLLSIIREEFGPLLDGTDLSLLAIVGSAGIGRVSVTPEDVQPMGALDPFEIKDLLKAENTADHFASLIRRYARVSVSGMMPKFIAPAERTDVPVSAPLGKSALFTSRHIVKGSDDSTPYLGFNEHYSMKVLGRLGVVPVARTQMSDDGRVLVVERFDVDSVGTPICGFEDACSLLGLPAYEKYATTTERVLNAMRPYIAPDRLREQMVQFGWQTLINYVIRNGDCHAKNIALLYTQLSDVKLTPVYDLVTTAAYPRFAANPPSLSVGGRKTWAAGKPLTDFFKARLGISPKAYAEMLEQLCDSAVEVGKEVIQAAQNESRWRPVAKQMVHAWNQGMATLRDPNLMVGFAGLDAEIAAAGFSDPAPPERSRKIVGRSELLASREKGKD